MSFPNFVLPPISVLWTSMETRAYVHFFSNWQTSWLSWGLSFRRRLENIIEQCLIFGFLGETFSISVSASEQATCIFHQCRSAFTIETDRTEIKLPSSTHTSYVAHNPKPARKYVQSPSFALRMPVISNLLQKILFLI